MKIKEILLLVVSTIALISCGEKTTNYKLETKSSILKWHGEENPEHFRTGTLRFSEGSLTMTGELIDKGTFKIDFSTLEITDESLAPEKRDRLKMHLQAPDFFHMEKSKYIDVSVGKFENGELETTIDVLGTKITQKIPVEVKKSSAGVEIKGDFNFDLTNAKIEGLQPDPETGEGISPIIKYALHLVLTKQ